MSTRRRIASFILLIGVLFLGARFLGSREKLVPATIVYKLPAGTSRLEAEFRESGKDTLVARQVAAELQVAREVRQAIQLPPGTLDLSVTLTSDAGAETRTRRTIEVARDAVVTVDLGL